MADKGSPINEIKRCMRHLRLSCNEASTQKAEAEIEDSEGVLMPGSITVIFKCNHHTGRGPSIEVGDIIKGYGIPFNEFKPQYQEFEFSKSNRLLTITGDNYKFSFKF